MYFCIVETLHSRALKTYPIEDGFRTEYEAEGIGSDGHRYHYRHNDDTFPRKYDPEREIFLPLVLRCGLETDFTRLD